MGIYRLVNWRLNSESRSTLTFQSVQSAAVESFVCISDQHSRQSSKIGYWRTFSTFAILNQMVRPIKNKQVEEFLWTLYSFETFGFGFVLILRDDVAVNHWMSLKDVTYANFFHWWRILLICMISTNWPKHGRFQHLLTSIETKFDFY